MASIAIRVPDQDTEIDHFYTFDHLGREIPLVGYEGGLQSLSSNSLNEASLRSIIADSAVVEDVTPTPFVREGSFGERTGREARRA